MLIEIHIEGGAMAFKPKEKTWGHYQHPDYVYTATGKLIPYDPVNHKYFFVWPFKSPIPNKELGIGGGDFDYQEVLIGYPTVFKFKERYNMLKEKGWHCGGPEVDKKCFIFHMRKENTGTNSHLRIALKWDGDIFFWVGRGQENKDETLDQVINVFTMFA